MSATMITRKSSGEMLIMLINLVLFLLISHLFLFSALLGEEVERSAPVSSDCLFRSTQPCFPFDLKHEQRSNATPFGKLKNWGLCGLAIYSSEVGARQ